jgi:hypothetical protein
VGVQTGEGRAAQVGEEDIDDGEDAGKEWRRKKR